LIRKSRSVGRLRGWNEYDNMNQIPTYYSRYEVPRITGIVLWYDWRYVFRGLMPIHRNLDADGSVPFAGRIDYKAEEQGRIAFIFADDEYIVDIRGRKLGWQVRDVWVVTNKGIYDCPAHRGVGYYSFKPQKYSYTEQNVLIGFGGEYNWRKYSYFYGYFVDINSVSQEQKEQYF